MLLLEHRKNDQGKEREGNCNLADSADERGIHCLIQENEVVVGSFLARILMTGCVLNAQMLNSQDVIGGRYKREQRGDYKGDTADMQPRLNICALGSGP